MNNVCRFALYFDESGRFGDTSTDSNERAGDKWPSQLMGVVVPLATDVARDAETVLKAAHKAAGLKLPDKVHASADAIYRRGSDFDRLIDTLLKECHRRWWQPVRCWNAEGVSFGTSRDNYLCLVGLLVCRTIDSLDRRDGGQRVELRVTPARKTDPQPDIVTGYADIRREEYEREIRRMLGITLGMTPQGQDRVEVTKPEDAKVIRLLQICDLLSSASKNKFDRLGERARERFQRILAGHDWSFARFRPDDWLQPQDHLLLEDSDFIGREQVFGELNRLLQQRSSGVVLIQGQPGRGKTALLARLLRRPEQLLGSQVKDLTTPVGFFFRRTDGRTKPDMAVRHLYAALLQSHNIWEPPSDFREPAGERLVREFSHLLQNRIAVYVSPARPQLLLIDALDEADDIAAACGLVPCPLPDGVFVVATVRPGMVPEVFEARRDLVSLNLESPHLERSHRHDVLQFIERETLGLDLERDTRRKLARACAGNFLVARAVCAQLQSGLQPGELREFLDRVGKTRGPEQLGTIYAEFWDRLDAKRATVPRRRQLLHDGAALFAAAATSVTQEIVCKTLDWRFDEWDEVRTALQQYLTETNRSESTAQPRDSKLRVYRLYHESFAEWIRGRFGPLVQEMHSRLANFCAKSSKQTVGGYSREYALRFLVHHTVAAKRLDDAVQVISDLRFIQARAEMGTVAGLLSDYADARRALPEVREEIEWERERDEEMDRWTAAISEYSREWTRRRREYTRDPTTNEALKYADIPVPSPPSTAPIIGRMRKMEARYAVLNEASRVSRLARLRAFEHFVALNVRHLGRFPKYTPVLARNFARAGPVAQQGEDLCQDLEDPWLAQIERVAEAAQPPLVSRIIEATTEDECWILSRDGRIGILGQSRVYDVRNGEELASLPEGVIHELSPDGSLVLLALSAKPESEPTRHGAECTLAVVSSPDGRILRGAQFGEGDILAADFTADGSMVAALRDDGAVLVWDGEEVASIGSLPLAPRARTPLWLSWCGRWLLGYVASEENDREKTSAVFLDVWSRSSTFVGPPGVDLTEAAGSAILARWHHLVDDHSADGRLKMEYVKDQHCLHLREQHEDGTSALMRELDDCHCQKKFSFLHAYCHISADGRIGTFSDSGQGRVFVLDLVHGRPNPRSCARSSQRPSAMLSPDGVCEVRFESADTISIWHKDAGQCLRELRTGSISHCARFSVDGSLLMTTTQRRCERIIRKMKSAANRSGGPGTDLDDERLVEQATIWDIYAGDVYQRFETNVLVLGPDGATYVQRQDNVGVWNPLIRDWEDPTSLPHYPPFDASNELKGFVHQLTADGRNICSERDIVSSRTGAEVTIEEILDGDEGVLHPLLDGQHFVAASWMKPELILWDHKNRTVVASMPLPDSFKVDSVAIPGLAYCDPASEGGRVELRNFRITPRVTATRRFRIDLPAEVVSRTSNRSEPLFSGLPLPGVWEEELTYLCPACRTHRAVERRVRLAIQGIADNAGLLPHHLPTLVLPDEAWDEPALKSQCDACGQQVCFNPFVFDRRCGRFQELTE